MSGVQDNGRVPTVLNDEEIDAFNDRFAMVMLFDRGVALVFDEATGAHHTFTRFKREFGVRGELWLNSDRKRAFTNLAAYEADKRQRVRVTNMGQSCAVSGGRQLPPTSKTINEIGWA